MLILSFIGGADFIYVLTPSYMGVGRDAHGAPYRLRAVDNRPYDNLAYAGWIVSSQGRIWNPTLRIAKTVGRELYRSLVSLPRGFYF